MRKERNALLGLSAFLVRPLFVFEHYALLIIDAQAEEKKEAKYFS